MKKVSDYVMDFLFEHGVTDMFMVPGGGSIKLCTSLMESKINYRANHDEQACGMAAEAYARYGNRIGAVLVTSGPGATNTLTAVAEAYFNNSPCLFISGQVTTNHTISYQSIEGLRQIGVQEIDIVPVVKSITKYAVMIKDAKEIRYHLEKAIYESISGRPGPVWLDIPVDIQGASVEEDVLEGYLPEPQEKAFDSSGAEYALRCIRDAKRPVFLIGQGVRLAGAQELVENFIIKYDIPVVSSYLGLDIISRDLKNNMRNIGFKGSRYGNITVQDADLVISLGSRMSIATVGYASHLFAREAKIIAVDIDESEHRKNTVKLERFIHSDVKEFLDFLEKQAPNYIHKPFTDWLDHCVQLKKTYPVCSEELKEDSEKGLNPYHVIDILTKETPAEIPIVADTGTALFVTSQCGNFKRGQRYIPSGFATMGYSLPAAIGIAYAENKNRPVITLTGDGSMQMNLQELQTIVHNQLPLKIFVMNNQGYYTMKPIINRGYNADLLYRRLKENLTFPDLQKLAEAYGIRYIEIRNNEDIERQVNRGNLCSKEPIIFDVKIREDFFVYTVTTFHEKDGSIKTRPLEDIYPFLDKDELYGNMTVKPIY